MDCAACGKPLSVTAKFCGKCGAPVKRSTKAPESEANNSAHPELAFGQEEAKSSDAPVSVVEASAPAESVHTTETTPTAPVDGTITDADTGKPIPNAMVLSENIGDREHTMQDDLIEEVCG